MDNIQQGAPWDAGVHIASFPSLSESLTADVVIVGGGITGITAAYLLSDAGLNVVLLEKDKIGSGATGATTAFLTQVIDTSFHDLISIYGKENARTIIESHGAAIAQVEEIVRSEKIDCEFMRCNNYIYANDEKEYEYIKDESAAAHELGLHMDHADRDSLPFPNAGYVHVANQAKFHPRKYLASLVDILTKRGVRIFENTEVLSALDGVVRTASYAMYADHIFVATYAPFDKKLFFKKAFYTSYVYELSAPSGSIPEGIYEDTADPYRYFRVDAMHHHDRILIGGEDHRSDIPVSPDKSFAALREHIADLFSSIPYTFVRQWKGPILEPVDGLAFIGPVDEDNVLYATGFSGTGMTYGTISAMMVADKVLGRKNIWSSIYDARRTPTLRALAYKGLDYTQEFVGGALHNTITKHGE